MAYVDLRAAFDSLGLSSLWLLLTRLGIPDKIVSNAVYAMSPQTVTNRLRRVINAAARVVTPGNSIVG